MLAMVRGASTKGLAYDGLSHVSSELNGSGSSFWAPWVDQLKKKNRNGEFCRDSMAKNMLKQKPNRVALIGGLTVCEM
jgi:hypothetical protein